MMNSVVDERRICNSDQNIVQVCEHKSENKIELDDSGQIPFVDSIELGDVEDGCY